MDLIDPSLFHIPEGISDREYKTRLQLILKEIVEKLNIFQQIYEVEHNGSTGKGKQ